MEEEVILLQAMYMDELTTLNGASGELEKLEINLTPNTAMEDTMCFIKCTLALSIPQEYPQEPPKIVLKNERGMDDEQSRTILHKLQLKAKELIGTPMLFELVQFAKDLLTENNVPKTDCVICLCPFEEEESSSATSYMKTTCFHYFHKYCLAEWCFKSEERIEKEKEDEMQDRTMKKKERLGIVCPVCKSQLTADDFQQVDVYLNPMRTQREQTRRDLLIKEQREREAKERLERELKEREEQQRREEEEALKQAEEKPVPEPVEEPKPIQLPTVIKVLENGQSLNNAILKSIFEPLGAERCKVMFQKNGQRLGFALIEFGSGEAAQNAMNSMNNKEVNGYVISCKYAEKGELELLGKKKPNPIKHK